MLKFLGINLGVLLGLLLNAPQAEAGFNATLNSVATNNGSYVTLNVQNTNAPVFGENVIAGQLNWTATSAVSGLTGAGNTFGTFCIEIPQNVYLGTSYTLSQTDLTSLPTSGPALSPLKVAQIQALWAASYGSIATATDSAAFQVAIWEIVYQSGSTYDVGSGNFTASGNSTVTLQATAYLDLAKVSGSGFDANGVLRTNNGTGTVLARANVVGFEVTANGTGDYQDQIAEVTAAPAPPALVLFLSGFVPFWAFRRLMKPSV
jgi:hypothetical protein